MTNRSAARSAWLEDDARDGIFDRAEEDSGARGPSGSRGPGSRQAGLGNAGPGQPGSGARPLPGIKPLDIESARGSRHAGRRWRIFRNRWTMILTGMALLMVAGGLVAAGVSLRDLVSRDARFRIAGTSHIQALGLAQLSRTDVLPVFAEDIGRNLFFVDLDQRRKQLERIPWVEHATVMRVFPDQLRVAIVERTPVAFVQLGQQVGLVDADGVLLTMPPELMAAHHYSFPVVSGIGPSDPVPSRKAKMAVYLRFLAELDANGQHLSDRISEIDLSDPEDVRARMPEQGSDVLAHFGDRSFLSRYQTYQAHIGEWKQRYPQLAAVDLRYDGQVPLEMASSKDAATGSDSDAGPEPAAGPVDKQGAATGMPLSRSAEAVRPSAKQAVGDKSGQEKSDRDKPALLHVAGRRVAADGRPRGRAHSGQAVGPANTRVAERERAKARRQSVGKRPASVSKAGNRAAVRHAARNLDARPGKPAPPPSARAAGEAGQGQ